jgi:hypothetical protein
LQPQRLGSFSEPIRVAVAILTSATLTSRRRLGFALAALAETDTSFLARTSFFVITDGDEPLPNATTLYPASLSIFNSRCTSDHDVGLCCKTAFAYEVMSVKAPNAHWYYRAMDDTLLMLENLFQFVAALDATQSHFVGFRQTFLKSQGGPYRFETIKFPEELHSESSREHVYAHGGPGWLLSRGTLQRLAPLLQSDFVTRRCKGSSPPADDVQLSATLLKTLQVPLTHHQGFFIQRFVISKLQLPCVQNFSEYRHLPIAVHMVQGSDAYGGLARDQSPQMPRIAALLRNRPYSARFIKPTNAHPDNFYWQLAECG